MISMPKCLTVDVGTWMYYFSSSAWKGWLHYSFAVVHSFAQNWDHMTEKPGTAFFSWYSSATQSSSPPNKCTSGVLISCPIWKISTKCKTNQVKHDIKKRKRGHTVSVKLCRILRFLSCSLPSLNRRYKRSCQSQGLFCRCWIRSLILRAQKVHPVTFVNKNYIHSTFSRIKNQTYIWTQSLRGGIITSSTTG